MDVEGEEMWSLPQMVKSGAFKNVQQLHIEVHINEGSHDQMHLGAQYKSIGIIK